MAKKDIVAKYHCGRCAGQKVFSKNKRLRQSLWVGLYFIVQVNAPLAAITQQALELFLIFWRRNDQNIADTYQHKNCQRVEPRARPSSQNNTLTLHHAVTSDSFSISFNLCTNQAVLRQMYSQSFCNSCENSEGVWRALDTLLL